MLSGLLLLWLFRGFRGVHTDIVVVGDDEAVYSGFFPVGYGRYMVMAVCTGRVTTRLMCDKLMTVLDFVEPGLILTPLLSDHCYRLRIGVWRCWCRVGSSRRSVAR